MQVPPLAISPEDLFLGSLLHPWPLELCGVHSRGSLNAGKMPGGDDGAGTQASVLKPVGPSSPSAKKTQLLRVGKCLVPPCVALGVVTGGAIWPDQDDPAVPGGQGRGRSPHPHTCPSGIRFGHHQAPASDMPHSISHWALGGQLAFRAWLCRRKEEQLDTAKVLRRSQPSKQREGLLRLQETIEWEALRGDVYLGGQVD